MDVCYLAYQFECCYLSRATKCKIVTDKGTIPRTLRRHYCPFSERVFSISCPWFGRIQRQFKICFWLPSVGLSISGATKPCLANDALPLQPSLPQPSSYARSYRDDWEESILYITSALCSLKHLLHYGMCLLEL